MRLLKNPNFDFIGYWKPALAFSAVFILTGLAAMTYHHFTTGAAFNFGVDFVGGSLLQYQFTQAPDLDQIRDRLKEIGFGDVSIQTFGDEREVIIRLRQNEGDIKETGDSVTQALQTSFGAESVQIRRIESVGPQVGRELQTSALYASIGAGLLMLLYIAFRFEFRYGLGAVLAIIHDVLVILTVFAVLRLEMNMQVVAAIMTIIGFSVNDTIVIFDRVRENLKLNRRMDYPSLINLTVNQTLSRTILTAMTVFISVLSLAVFGGEVIRNFALAMLAGVITGTYSTVYIASPFVVQWERLRQRRPEAPSGRGR